MGKLHFKGPVLSSAPAPAASSAVVGTGAERPRPVMYGKELLSADELARYDNVKLIVSLQGITTLLAYESPGSFRHSTLLANRRLVSDAILARMDAARPLPDEVEVPDEVQE